MLSLLTAPWALAALAAVPALAALYWLRNTWREVPVSSLMLWLYQSESQASGLRVRRLQTPLLFYVEIAALVLLAFAACGPRVDTGQGRWPLVVVLDDSFSMLAGGDESPRLLAEAALKRELYWGDSQPVRFLLAGDSPQTLGDTMRSWTEAQATLRNWSCRSATARLAETAALAGELSGDRARILIVTDHPPEYDPGEGRIQWWSFGRTRPNQAFVNAGRSTRDGLERVHLEVGNFAARSQTTTLTLHSGESGLELYREALTLDPQEVRRVVLRLPQELPIVTARLSDDALAVDNLVTLVREETPSIRVRTEFKYDGLRAPVERALTATGKITLAKDQPHLVVTDHPEPQSVGAETWVVQMLAEKEAEAYLGPFVLDRTHPLTEGLNLAGVVWGAGKTRDFAGAPVVMAGGIPLITDTENLAGQHHLRLRLRPDLSTVLDSPAWPILVWNLVQWRANELPGMGRANLRLGDTATARLPLGVESVIHVSTSGATRSLAGQSQRVSLRPEEPGLHNIEADGTKYTFAVNALRREESDLTKCETRRVGDWSDDMATAPALVDLGWIPLLLALAVLTLHLFLAAKAGK